MPAKKNQGAPAKFALRMTATLGKEAKASAAREGVSLNQFINLAVAEKVEYLENEAWIAKRHAPSQDRIDAALKVLHRKGTQAPAPGDEIPAAFRAWEQERNRKSRQKAS